MKTALVTGGTRGIGLSTAQKFIDQGWNVYITSRKEENLEACLLYTSPSPRDGLLSRMPSSA